MNKNLGKFKSISGKSTLIQISNQFYLSTIENTNL